MTDINETEGLKCLSSLCDQYSTDVVSFTKVNVSVTEQLVRTSHMTDGLVAVSMCVHLTQACALYTLCHGAYPYAIWFCMLGFRQDYILSNYDTVST